MNRKPNRKQARRPKRNHDRDVITWTNERRRLADLKPQEDNPRQIEKAQAERLVKSFDEFNQVETLAINPDGAILNGHQRYYVLLAAYDDPDYEVDVRVASRPLTRREWQKLTVYLHEGTVANWDWDGLANWEGVGVDELVEWGFSEEALLGGEFSFGEEPTPDLGPQLDKAAELQEKWKVKTGDLWEIGRHLLHCGDSSTIEIETPNNLFYDPPWDARVNFSPAQWDSVLAFCDGRRAADIVGLMGAPAWIFSWDCITSWYTPNRPLQRAKYCFWYGDITQYDFDGAHYGEPLEAHTVKNTRGEYEFKPDKRGKHLSDMFQLGITGLHKDGLHKHEKPLDWVRLLIGNCFEGDVYDPFTGSGTTFVACEQLGWRTVGVEIEPKNCALVLQRLCDMGLEPRRVNG